MASFEDRHKVTLRVTGRDYPSWTSATISYGVEAMARSFALEVTYTEPDPGESPVHFCLGDALELFVGRGRDKVPVVTGYVDTIDGDLDAFGASLSVVGRSKTGDLIDCSVVGQRRFSQLPMGSILLTLLDAYGVSASVEGDIGEIVNRFKIDVGERVEDALQRLSERFGFLVYDDAVGDLIFQRAVAGSFPRSPGDLIEVGRNVLRVSSRFDATEVYSQYRCRGQTVGTDQGYGEAVAGIEAVADCAAMTRNRVLVLTGDGDTRNRCKARAQYEAAARIGRSASVTYTMRGWYRNDGTLWQPGTLVKVLDTWNRIDGLLAIGHVTLAASVDGGFTADLSCGPEAGFLAALPTGTKRSIGAWRNPV